jgi:hypothetical protein
MVVASQDHLNRLTGLELALENREIEEVRLSMAGDYSVFDVMPQRWVRMTLDAGDTPRGISGTDMRFVPRSVTQYPDPLAGGLTVDVILEPRIKGPDGVFDPCPIEGAPATPPLAEQKGQPPLPGVSATALASMGSLNVLRTGQTTWLELDDTFAGNDFSVDPYWRIKQKSVLLGRTIYWVVGNACMVRRFVGTQEKTGYDIGAAPPNSWSDGTAPTTTTTHLIWIASSIFATSRHYVAANHLASGGWRAWVGRTDNDFATLSWTTLFEMDDVQTKLLSLAEDIEDGSRLWLTCWRDGELWLERWETDGMTRETAVDLGAATEAELITKTYIAYVAAFPVDKDKVVVYGRMADPAGLSGTYQVILSDDAGSSFSSKVNDWDDDHCGSLEVRLADDDSELWYAARLLPVT